jgi:hypothetical protein
LVQARISSEYSVAIAPSDFFFFQPHRSCNQCRLCFSRMSCCSMTTRNSKEAKCAGSSSGLCTLIVLARCYYHLPFIIFHYITPHTYAQMNDTKDEKEIEIERERGIDGSQTRVCISCTRRTRSRPPISSFCSGKSSICLMQPLSISPSPVAFFLFWFLCVP